MISAIRLFTVQVKLAVFAPIFFFCGVNLAYGANLHLQCGPYLFFIHRTVEQRFEELFKGNDAASITVTALIRGQVSSTYEGFANVTDSKITVLSGGYGRPLYTIDRVTGKLSDDNNKRFNCRPISKRAMKKAIRQHDDFEMANRARPKF